MQGTVTKKKNVHTNAGDLRGRQRGMDAVAQAREGRVKDLNTWETRYTSVKSLWQDSEGAQISRFTGTKVHILTYC
jgi:hypothetical protein